MFKPIAHYSMLLLLLSLLVMSVNAQEALPESFPVGTVIEGVVEVVGSDTVTINGITYSLTFKLDEALFVPGANVSVVVVLSETQVMTIIRFTAPPVANDDDEACEDDTATSPDAEDDCTTGEHPVGSAIAESVAVAYDEVMAWHTQGYGFGEIARAYLVAEETGESVDAIMARRASGEGWGSILQNYGLRPSQFNLGRIMNGHYVDTGIILPADVAVDGTLAGTNPPQTTTTTTPTTPPTSTTSDSNLNRFGCEGRGNSCNAPGHNR